MKARSAFVALAVVLGAASQAHQQGKVNDQAIPELPFFRELTHLQFFATDRRTLVLMPAQVVATGVHMQHAVSPHGRFIGWLLMDASVGGYLEDLTSPGMTMQKLLSNMPQYKVVVYDQQTHDVEVRAIFPRPQIATGICALDEDGSFIVHMMTPYLQEKGGSSTFYLSRRGQQVKTLFEETKFARLTGDPSGTYFAVSRGDGRARDVTIYDISGRTRLELKANQSFSLTGGQVLVQAQKIEDFKAYDIATGKEIPNNSCRPEPFARARSRFIEWKQERPAGALINTSKLRATVTETGETADVGAGVFDFYADPADRYIFYTYGDVVMLRELREIDPKIVARARKANDQRDAIDHAQECARALMNWAGNNNGMLPLGDDWKDWKAKASEFMEHKVWLDEFVFLLPGAQLTGMKEPEKTIIGMIVRPDGQAVAYADGHVVWKPSG